MKHRELNLGRNCTACHVLIGLHISRSYIGLPLFFLPLPIPEALYDTDLVQVCVRYDLVCNGHYNRKPDLGKYGAWWNTGDLARHSILDAEVLDRNVTWLTKHKDTS